MRISVPQQIDTLLDIVESHAPEADAVQWRLAISRELASQARTGTEALAMVAGLVCDGLNRHVWPWSDPKVIVEHILNSLVSDMIERMKAQAAAEHARSQMPSDPNLN